MTDNSKDNEKPFATVEEAQAAFREETRDRVRGAYKKRLIEGANRHFGVAEPKPELKPTTEVTDQDMDMLTIRIEGQSHKIPKDPAQRGLLDKVHFEAHRRLSGAAPEPGSYAERLMDGSRRHYFGKSNKGQ